MTIVFERVRMASTIPLCCYSIRVPTSEVDRSKHDYFILSGGKEYVLLADALTPDSHRAMPQGWERYDAWKRLVGDIAVWVWPMLVDVFPELATTTPPPPCDILSLPWCYEEHPSMEAMRDVDIPERFRSTRA